VRTASHWLLVLPLVAFGHVAEAQQKVPQLGFLFGATPSANTSRIKGFRQGLRDLGYVEGKNIVIEERYAEGKLDRLPVLATELVALKVDIIVTGSSPATHSAKNATLTIPIVMAQDPDPVENGFVASLAHPGGNITGMSNFSPELSGKRLEILKETIPRFSRVAVVGTSTQPGNAQALKETKVTAGTFGLKLQYLDVLNRSDIDTAFHAAAKESIDAVIVLQSSVLDSERGHIVAAAAKTRLPAIYFTPEWVEDGGLMTYGVSFPDLYRRAATYVDKILKGAKPADLPVEQPTKFELVINLKTAKQIGLTIPPNVLARADRVVK